jgi:signal transduction histidine kinase
MQRLVKEPARIGKFVPHATGVIADRKATQSLIPVLKTEHFDQLAHDARNVLSALRLYCELLAEPGILTPAHSHYAQELQAVTEIASCLLERLATPRRTGLRQSIAAAAGKGLLRDKVTISERCIDDEVLVANPWPDDLSGDPDPLGDLGVELLAMRPLLTAIAGPSIELEIEALPCEGRTRLSQEDLARVMLNLVCNASEAMPAGGRLRITAQYRDGLSFLETSQIPDGHPRSVLIAIEDTGSGISEELRELVFDAGFTTRETAHIWPAIRHRGLGLTIVAGLIEAAGGTVRVCSSPGGGARFEVDLPLLPECMKSPTLAD